MNPVLLLHGALGSASQLEPLQKQLELKGRKVHKLNFSGHSGEPFANDFGIETFAGNIERFVSDNNLSQVDIFGYSMGGYVAVWFAIQNPEKVSSIVTLGTKFDWSKESASKEVRKLDPVKIEEKVPAFARILEKRHSDWKELLNKTASMMLGLGEKPLLIRENLSTIHTKITICLGDQDDMADRNFSEEVASWLPNGLFQLFENTPHPIEKVRLEFIEKYF